MVGVQPGALRHVPPRWGPAVFPDVASASLFTFTAYMRPFLIIRPIVCLLVFLLQVPKALARSRPRVLFYFLFPTPTPGTPCSHPASPLDPLAVTKQIPQAPFPSTAPSFQDSSLFYALGSPHRPPRSLVSHLF